MEYPTTRSFARTETQDTTSLYSCEQSYDERDLKRRRLASTTEQDGMVDSRSQDATDPNGKETQEEHDRLDDCPKTTRFETPHPTTEHNVEFDARLKTLKQMWPRTVDDVGPTANSSSTRDTHVPLYYSSGHNRNLGFDEHSRGRTPQRVEHTRHSPGTRPVSRAGSASSARSMIDERLEWAHQDRMRSASRDRSAPPSPFHEHSPFYAEHARYTIAASPANEDRSIIAAGLPHGPQAQSFECSRVNPFTGKPCNTIFSRSYDLKRHEDDVHDNRKTRYPCPHCPEGKSFTQRDALDRHIHIVHPKPDTHHYSCAALPNLEDVTCQVRSGLSKCAYCGMEFPDGSLNAEWLSGHLIRVHKFRRCDTREKFYQPNGFRRHLVESHAASSSGEWTDILCNRSIGNKEAAIRCTHTSSTPMPGPPSLEESSSQCVSLSKRAHDDVPQASYTCECCPEEPRTFDTKDDLRVHESTKKYICSFCRRRFPSIFGVVTHENLHHLGQHHWSCAALANPEDAIFRDFDNTPCCGYCSTGFGRGYSDEDIVAHVINDHQSGDCDKEKKFKWAAHFRAHLRKSHGAFQGPWIHRLANLCKRKKTPPSDGVVATSVDATQNGFALQPAAVSTIQLPIPYAQDDVAPPLPAPIYIPEISTTPNSDGQSSDHHGAAGRRDSAAVRPGGSRLPDEGLDSSHLIGVASDDGVTRKRRMSSPVSNSAKDSWWTGSTTQAGIEEAAAVKSSAGEGCTKPAAPPPERYPATGETKPASLHVCSMCQRIFARRTILINHERTHTGERPYSCTFEGCSQAFAQQGDKTRHETTQHTEKIFRCGSSHNESPSWGCGKKFRRKDGLLEHHSKTKKGKQCVADRDHLMELGRVGDGESPAFP